MDFYVVCGTIIPVLFLALIYQVELFRQPRHRELTKREFLFAGIGLALVGLVAATAEGEALHVLSVGHGSHGQRSAVGTGVWALTVLTCLMPAVIQAADAAQKITHPRQKGLARLGVLAGTILVGVVAVALNPI